MKKAIVVLLTLVIVLVFVPPANTNPDNSSYDPMSDVNRDGVIDVNDLARLGQAYGSSLVLASEPSKTVVTVLSFDKEPPEVENARVAIIDPEVCGDSVNVTYTNSSGIATFELSPNKNYTAIAWNGSAYNYANLTTNSFSEASVLILLGEPSLPPIRRLPQRWIAISFFDNETGLPFWYMSESYLRIDALTAEIGTGGGAWSFENNIWDIFMFGGVFILPINSPTLHEPYSSRVVRLWGTDGRLRGFSVYCPDENGCANVVIYI